MKTLSLADRRKVHNLTGAIFELLNQSGLPANIGVLALKRAYRIATKEEEKVGVQVENDGVILLTSDNEPAETKKAIRLTDDLLNGTVTNRFSPDDSFKIRELCVAVIDSHRVILELLRNIEEVDTRCIDSQLSNYDRRAVSFAKSWLNRWMGIKL